MKKILLKHGECALVDDKDYFELRNTRWHLSKGGYARCSSNGKKIYMHHHINKTPRGFHTDHINRNKLDNRKSNLRTVTCSQNLHNSKIQRNDNSGYRGVYWYERYKKWEVYINVRGKRIYLKRFSSLRDAIKARKLAEKKYL